MPADLTSGRGRLWNLQSTGSNTRWMDDCCWPPQPQGESCTQPAKKQRSCIRRARWCSTHAMPKPNTIEQHWEHNRGGDWSALCSLLLIVWSNCPTSLLNRSQVEEHVLLQLHCSKEHHFLLGIHGMLVLKSCLGFLMNEYFKDVRSKRNKKAICLIIQVCLPHFKESFYISLCLKECVHGPGCFQACMTLMLLEKHFRPSL